jgi:acetyl esterase
MRNSMSLPALLTLIIFFAAYKGHAQTCKSGTLNAEVAGFLKRIPADNRSLEEMKSSPNFVEYRRNGPPAIPYPAKDVEHIKVTADSIPVLVFNPSHAKGLPIIINYHPGGFISPLTAGMEYMAWNDAQTFNAIVFAVDYRVAPENKFPVPVNDCYNAFRWISENGQKFGGDLNRIAVMGVSAGANLAAVVCQKAKQDGIGNRIKLQIMNSPVVDNPGHADLYSSINENANGYMLTKAGVLFALETYAEEKDRNNPEFAPILSKNLSGLPPAVMITAEFDPLRDEGVAYADLLKKAGVKVWQQCFTGEIHCLIATPVDGQHAKAYQQIIATAIAETMSSK